MKLIKRTTRRWLPLVLWMTAIFMVSHQPSGTIPQYGSWDVLLKKGGHVVAYAILAILARRAGLSGKAALLLGVLYAVSDELHQRFIPGRSGRPLDVFIDSLGLSMGLGAYHWFDRRWRESRWGRRDVSAGRSPRDAS